MDPWAVHGNQDTVDLTLGESWKLTASKLKGLTSDPQIYVSRNVVLCLIT